MLDRHTVRHIKCRITALPRLSSNPPAHQGYQRRNVGRDRPGGGAEIPCNYFIYYDRNKFEETMHILEDCVSRAELDMRVHA